MVRRTPGSVEKRDRAGSAEKKDRAGAAEKRDRVVSGAGRSGQADREKPEKAKRAFKKPGNFLYPVPAVMVSLLGKDDRPNIITVAWCGTVCSDPPMVSISVRKERYSHAYLEKNGEFVINLVNRPLAKACDYCGCTSGADRDKFADMHLTPEASACVAAPSVAESPVAIECRVRQVMPLGSHDLFLSEVVAVRAAEEYFDDRGAFHLEDAGLVAYSHGKYYALGKMLGTFGYSVKKKPAKKKTDR